eukprot:1196400-Prorocentrum_minimum.AAC.4
MPSPGNPDPPRLPVNIRATMQTVEGAQAGKYRSSVDACEPQNPTKSEEYQRHLLQGSGSNGV